MGARFPACDVVYVYYACDSAHTGDSALTGVFVYYACNVPD
jgi:hypothetical protein